MENKNHAVGGQIRSRQKKRELSRIRHGDKDALRAASAEPPLMPRAAHPFPNAEYGTVPKKRGSSVGSGPSELPFAPMRGVGEGEKSIIRMKTYESPDAFLSCISKHADCQFFQLLSFCLVVDISKI